MIPLGSQEEFVRRCSSFNSDLLMLAGVGKEQNRLYTEYTGYTARRGVVDGNWMGREIEELILSPPYHSVAMATVLSAEHCAVAERIRGRQVQRRGSGQEKWT